MLGRFIMVCRDARTHKARKVPGLVVESEEEVALWKIGQGEVEPLVGKASKIWMMLT